MLLTLLLLVAGLILLTGGAESLVRGSSSLAFRLGISPLVVGLTIVAFGTSAPELVVSIGAALRGSPDMAIGNVVGSNIANIALILGIAALIYPVKISAQIVYRDVPIMLVSTLVVLALVLSGSVTRVLGSLLFAGLVAYTLNSYLNAKRSTAETIREVLPDEAAPPSTKPLLAAVLVAAGVGALAAGAHIFVLSASDVARVLGVSDTVIGLSIVAVGTSLPELATTVIASIRKASDIVAGNIIGSNIFNLLCILGITAMVRPLEDIALSVLDLFVFAATAVLVLVLMKTGHMLSRLEGVTLLGLYVAYVVLLF